MTLLDTIGLEVKGYVYPNKLLTFKITQGFEGAEGSALFLLKHINESDVTAYGIAGCDICSLKDYKTLVFPSVAIIQVGEDMAASISQLRKLADALEQEIKGNSKEQGNHRFSYKIRLSNEFKKYDK